VSTFELPGAEENPSYLLVRDVEDRLRGLIPPTTGDLTPAGQIARRVYSRLDAPFQAIGVLLAMNLPEDAYALTRGLMFDAERLQTMAAANPKRRESLAVGWHDTASRDIAGRARLADQFGKSELANHARSVAERNREANDAVKRDRGIVPMRFPAEGGGLADAAGHPEDKLDYSLASDPSHSALVASLWHDRDGGHGVVLAGASDPAWTRHVAGQSTRHFLRAAAAVGVICGLSSATTLASLRDTMERDIDAGSLPERETVRI
jgi:hypothetical protein